jgi:dephospho-CoA kinase
MVGLTGGIGAGKSTVARALAAHGGVVIDADAIAREIVEPDGPAFAPLVERFGPSIVGPDGRLDRPALAAVAFADEAARKDLNAITHPLVGQEFARQMAAAPPHSIVIMDVPLLVESALERGYEYVVVVETPRDLRLERLELRGVPRADAEARMAAQATDEQRRAVANNLLSNQGDEAALQAQVDELWAELVRLEAEKPEPPAEREG